MRNFFYGVFILLAFLLVFASLKSLGYLSFFTDTVVERKVFENSYQYTEARKTEVATFRASLTEIERKLTNTDLTQTQRKNLESQAAGLRIQLSVAQSK